MSPTATATSVRPGAPRVGELLRDWRQRRRQSQLELAVNAEVSARHLSFVETGRSKPSRELILHLAEHLEVPLRERNALLLAAGYAPVYRQRQLGDDEMAPVRAALDKLLAGHEPFPALVVDRHWNLVTANGATMDLLAGDVDADLLVPPVNVLRIALHPRGLARRIVNLAEWSAHILERLERQVAASGDPDLAQMLAELSAYPGMHLERTGHREAADWVFVPLVLRGRDGGPELRFFSTLATFGTPLEVTTAELLIESFFPADEVTSAALRARL